MREGRGSQWRRPVMTEGASVQLSHAGQPRRVDDRARTEPAQQRAFARHMCAARAMTRFARYSQYRVVGPVAVDGIGIGYRLESRGVALQASRTDGTVEIGSSIRIPRAVRPPDPCPVRDRELIQPVADQVEKRLSLSQARHVRNALRVDGGVGRATHHRGFIEAGRRGVHTVVQAWIDGPQHVLTGTEAGQDGVASRQSRRQTVGGRFVARLLLMTGQAGCVTRGVVCTHRLGVMPARDESRRNRPGGQQQNPDDHRQLTQPSYGSFSARAMTTKV